MDTLFSVKRNIYFLILFFFNLRHFMVAWMIHEHHCYGNVPIGKLPDRDSKNVIITYPHGIYILPIYPC